MAEGLGMNFGMAVPLDYSTISEQAQGMTFYNDKLLLSHSFGILPSRVVFYEKSDKRLYVDENSAVSYRFPERIEQDFCGWGMTCTCCLNPLLMHIVQRL